MFGGYVFGGYVFVLSVNVCLHVFVISNRHCWTASLAQWLLSPPQERNIRGLIPAFFAVDFSGSSHTADSSGYPARQMRQRDWSARCQCTVIG